MEQLRRILALPSSSGAFMDVGNLSAANESISAEAGDGPAVLHTPDTAALRLPNAAALRRPDALILREKDLPPGEYLALMREVMPLCEQAGVSFIAHYFVSEAITAGAEAIHLPMPVFLEMSEDEKRRFRIIGVSTHSMQQARQAWQGGASYITASHIFPTQCKAGLPPRGLDFLREVCAESPIPVYALGGIHPSNISACIQAGAAGVCMMSEYMLSL